MRSVETESFTGDYSSDNLSKSLRELRLELELEFSGGEYVRSDSKTGTRKRVTTNTSIDWACDTALDVYTK